MSRLRYLFSLPKWVYFVAVAISMAIGYSLFSGRPREVETFSVNPRDIDTVLSLTGRIEPISEVSISSASSVAQVRQLLVDVGARVEPGQLLLKLDDGELLAQEREARSLLKQAEAELMRAQAAYRGSSLSRTIADRSLELSLELRASRDQAAENLRISEKRLLQVRARLQKVATGARPEDVRKAQASLGSAEATMADREREVKRQSYLYETGAVPKKNLESAELALVTATAATESARQELKSLESGRAEDIAESQAALAESETAYAAAKMALQRAERALQERLSLRSQAQSAANEVQVNQFALEAAKLLIEVRRARVDEIAAKLQQTELRAPIAGFVSRRDVSLGDTVQAGKVLLRITSGISFRASADVDEKLLPELKVGLAAIIRPDANPSMAYSAVVDQIGREANRTTGTVLVRFRLTSTDEQLRSDLTTNITVVTKQYKNAIVVPNSCIAKVNEASFVMIVEGKRVRRREVKVVSSTAEGVILASGVSAADELVLDAQAVTDGALVQSKRKQT